MRSSHVTAWRKSEASHCDWWAPIGSGPRANGKAPGRACLACMFSIWGSSRQAQHRSAIQTPISKRVTAPLKAAKNFAISGAWLQLKNTHSVPYSMPTKAKISTNYQECDQAKHQPQYGGTFEWPKPFHGHGVTTTVRAGRVRRSEEDCDLCLQDPSCPYMRRLECQTPHQNFGSL